MEKIQQKFWREMNTKGVFKNVRCCDLEVNPEGLMWQYFDDSDLLIETFFEKEEAAD